MYSAALTWRLTPEKVTLALKRIRDAAQVVAPTKTVIARTDPDDNIFSNAPRRLKRITSLPAINVIFPADGRRHA